MGAKRWLFRLVWKVRQVRQVRRLMRADHPCLMVHVISSFCNENCGGKRNKVESTVVQASLVGDQLASLAGWGKPSVDVTRPQRVSGESESESGESCEFMRVRMN